MHPKHISMRRPPRTEDRRYHMACPRMLAVLILRTGLRHGMGLTGFEEVVNHRIGLAHDVIHVKSSTIVPATTSARPCKFTCLKPQKRRSFRNNDLVRLLSERLEATRQSMLSPASTSRVKRNLQQKHARRVAEMLHVSSNGLFEDISNTLQAHVCYVEVVSIHLRVVRPQNERNHDIETRSTLSPAHGKIKCGNLRS